MAKIHFIYFDINTGSYPSVNHGIASLSAFAKSNGHSVSLHHLSKLESEHDVLKQVKESNADVVGFSFTTNQKQYVEKYSTAIHNEVNTIQIAGGIHPTIDPSGTLEIGNISGVCVGEGEFSVSELMRRIDNNHGYLDLPGFWWKDADGNVTQNQVPALNPIIDDLPPPDYSIFSTDQISRDSSGWVSLMLARGCPYNCYYCCNHILRSIYPEKKSYVRIPSAGRAIEIINSGMKYYKIVKGINFADDLLIFNKKWLREFSEQYKREIGLPYTCNGRIEHFTDDVIEMLKSSDCKIAYIGIESGNEWVRKNLLGRQHADEDIIDCFKRLRKAGIGTFAFNIMGFPFETKSQMMQTLAFNRKVKPNKGVVFYFYPYPATRLYDICKEFNLLDGKSDALSGYLEKPAIKLTHCDEADCIRLYSKLRLYLLSLNLATSLHAPGLSKFIFALFSIYPSFWVKLITRDSSIKKAARRMLYRIQFR